MYTGSSLEVFLVAAIIITLPFIESYSIDEKNETNVIIHCPFYYIKLKVFGWCYTIEIKMIKLS